MNQDERPSPLARVGRIRRSPGRNVGFVCLALVGGTTGCDLHDDIIGPGEDNGQPPTFESLFLSNPGGSQLGAAGASAVASVDPANGVIYVALEPGTVAGGALAVVTNATTGAEVAVAMAEGGFDPVPLPASAGDTIEVDIELTDGTHQPTLSSVVPSRRPPRIVRVSPPPRRRDVPINLSIRVVFSEPVDPLTVQTAHVRLDGSGTSVSGALSVSADGLRAEFVPGVELTPNADYTITVTTGVTDRTGDPLSETWISEFETGSTTALATVYTDPATLFLVTAPESPVQGELRTTELGAILHDDGRFEGRYLIYYPGGRRVAGSVVCFAIAGDTAWVAGTIEESVNAPSDAAVGNDIGFYVVDGGRPEGGIDQESYAWPLLANAGWGTPPDFCALRPTRILDGPRKDEDFWLHDVEGGDIVVTGSTPPPPRVASTIVKVGGDEQTDTVGATLAEPLSVRVLDARGVPVEGVEVSWRGPWVVNEPGAYPMPSATGSHASTTLTGSDGVARVDVALGYRVGSWKVGAQVGGQTAEVEFSVTTTAGRPVRFGWLNEFPYYGYYRPNQHGRTYPVYDVGITGVSLTTALAVDAFDRSGNAVNAAEMPIDWSVTSGEGVLTPLYSNGLVDSRRVIATPRADGPVVVTATTPDWPAVTDTIYGVAAIVLNPDYCTGSFDPSEVTVAVGRWVAWSICDSWAYDGWDAWTRDENGKWAWTHEHNVAFEDGVVVWPSTTATDEWRPHFRAFAERGTYRYRCTLHSNGFDDPHGEVGIVIVE